MDDHLFIKQCLLTVMSAIDFYTIYLVYYWYVWLAKYGDTLVDILKASKSVSNERTSSFYTVKQISDFYPITNAIYR